MEEAENLPRMQEDEVIPLLPSTYYPTLWIGGQELAARTAWYLIWEQARPRYPEAIAQHFLQVTPLWQVTPTPDGDVVYALYLGISSGMVNRLQGALAPLETAVKTQYPQQSFSLVVGPLLEEEESNTPR